MQANKFTKPKVFIWLVASLFIGLLIYPLYQVVTDFIFGRTIQLLSSPDEKHIAVLLKRNNLADYNLIVKVDGVEQYQSPDLCGTGEGSKKSLIWDRTGKIIVLEIAGTRVFAYDAENKRNLKKGELNQYEFSSVVSQDACVYLRDIDE